MRRFSTLPFEESVPNAEDLEESGRQAEDLAPPGHKKLGVAWFIATLAGVGVLAYAAMFPLPPMLSMAVLIGLLVLYAGYGYSLRKKSVVQFADSLYYMGFLWALFALIAAFVVWPAPKLTTDAVLRTFGYALITTFCGMMLRLVTIQFHETLPDRLVQAEETIDRRVAALIQQVNDATAAITSFKERAADELGESLRDLVQALTEIRDTMGEQQLAMAAAMSERVESALKEVLGRLSAVHVPQDVLTAEVGKLVAMLGKKGQELEKAAQGLEHSLMQTGETVKSFGQSLSRSEGVKHVEVAVGELARRIDERSEQFAEMTTALAKSRTELDGQLDSLQSLRASVVSVSQQLSAFETELKDMSLTAMSSDVRDGVMKMRHAVQSSLDASKAIESAMRGVLFFLRDKVAEERSNERT
ncbi:MAG TPA: hypothetical protein VFS39_00100 [Nitrospira sp.]|nr:hypothetical protein [Nitrospira sp.]